ncbi:MAG: hypothetical protein ACXVCR_09785 [Bdellovibrio sp.]
MRISGKIVFSFTLGILLVIGNATLAKKDKHQRDNQSEYGNCIKSQQELITFLQSKLKDLCRDENSEDCVTLKQEIDFAKELIKSCQPSMASMNKSIEI